MKYTFSILLFNLFALVGFGQLEIEGTVKYDDKPLSNVTVQLLEKGKVVRTLAANNRGKYNLEVPFGHYYQLVFRKAYMVPVAVDVSTHLTDELKNNSVVLPLNMELVYRYESMGAEYEQLSIGEIRQEGTGDKTFAFFPNAKNIALAKEMHELSRKLEARGDKPVAIANETLSKDFVERSTPKTKVAIKKAEPDGNKKNEIAADKKVEAIGARSEKIEISKQIESELLLKKNQDKKASSAVTGTNEYEHIYDNKKVLAAQSLEQSEVNAHKVDAMVHHQRNIDESLEKASERMRLRTSSSEPKLERQEGTFLSEEWFENDQQMPIANYKKVTYHFFLFDIDYFYKDSNEISETEYRDAFRHTIK